MIKMNAVYVWASDQTSTYDMVTGPRKDLRDDTYVLRAGHAPPLDGTWYSAIVIEKEEMLTHFKERELNFGNIIVWERDLQS